MKLIDLLVRELPKRGGWPDGAECAVQDADSQICFSAHSNVAINNQKTYWLDGQWSGGWSNPYLDDVARDRDSSIITRDQYQSALAASHKVGWSGDGLPPVGCECEFQSYSDTPWIQVLVIHYHDGNVWLKPLDGSSDFIMGNPSGFRPLRSEADKKRDIAAKEMARHANDDENRGFDAGLRNCLSIYDAIAAGKIPGVKLED